MIFSVADHVEQIVKGTKTQTRRAYTSKYWPGKTYAIQPGRGKLADPRGRILITHAWIESRERNVIHPFDAEAEGGYTPEEYEVLYEKLNPGWGFRWAYEFKFIPAIKEVGVYGGRVEDIKDERLRNILLGPFAPRVNQEIRK